MNVDPSLIASLMTVNPDKFNILIEDSFNNLYDLGRSLDYIQRDYGASTVYRYAIKAYMSKYPAEVDALAERITGEQALKNFIDSAAAQGKIPSLQEIAEIYAERDAYNRGKKPALQAPEVQQTGDLTKRQAFMLRMVLLANPGAKIPETAEGYNHIGRSAGYLEYTTENSSWYNLIGNQEFLRMLKNLSPELRKQIVTEIAKTVPRS